MEANETISRKQLMVELIFQDMRHQQLIFGLEAAGLTGDNHQLDLCILVARLQGIPEGKISDTWMEVYLKFMHEASRIELANHQALRSLAEQCYEHLMACYTVEVLIKEKEGG